MEIVDVNAHRFLQVFHELGELTIINCGDRVGGIGQRRRGFALFLIISPILPVKRRIHPDVEISIEIDDVRLLDDLRLMIEPGSLHLESFRGPVPGKGKVGFEGKVALELGNDAVFRGLLDIQAVRVIGNAGLEVLVDGIAQAIREVKEALGDEANLVIRVGIVVDVIMVFIGARDRKEVIHPLFFGGTGHEILQGFDNHFEPFFF